MATSTRKSVRTETTTDGTDGTDGSADVYVLPVVHTKVPGRLVNVGFWGGLTGAVLVGAVDLPLGVLVGAGVVVARHRTRRADASD